MLVLATSTIKYYDEYFKWIERTAERSRYTY